MLFTLQRYCNIRIANNLAKVNLHICRSFSAIASVLETPNIGEVTEIKGWIKSIRNQKELIFADISDGSGPNKLQVVIPKNLKNEFLCYGSAVHVTGVLTTNPRGKTELLAKNVKVIGKCVVSDGYPFNPRTSHPPEYIREYLHLRSRTNYMSAILRVRNAIHQLIHNYFSNRNYLLINTPILTSNDCEGAGEVFKIQPESQSIIKEMMKSGSTIDSVYFDTKTFLTVSGQLHLEAMCRGMGHVYTLGPTFRAENSKSRLHLSEFYMLEAELAFCDNLQEMQDVIEDFIKYIFSVIRDKHEQDLYVINKQNIKPNWLDKQFISMTYEEARDVLSKKGFSIGKDGINKEEELSLVEYSKGVPIFIVQWPKEMKSFYMKENEKDCSKVDALDLLTPVTGEIVGGSLREDDYDKLKAKLPTDRLDWYLELRKFGNIPTGGFGMGLERLLQTFCGINNIKDTIPFPRWPHNCQM